MAETVKGTPAADRMPSAVVIPTNGLVSAPAHSEQEDACGRLRGTVAFPRKRDIILTDEVEVDISVLPRWQPHICIDERRLTNDHDE